MKAVRRLPAVFLSILLIITLTLPAFAEASEHETTILFTHDLHSHFLPQPGEDGGESGGYARLATVLARERKKNPDALTLDAGDFSIGSLIQTLYTTRAAELRTMGALGFDATTLGNHEFDHKGVGLARMLQAAHQSGDTLPALVIANYKPANDNPNKLDIQRAMSAYGTQEYMLLERGGVTYGVFGLMGLDAHDCAPTSGFVLEDPAEAAQRCVTKLEELGAEFIICLSHSGTDEKEKKSEDEQLAKAVEGIDVIISGHTHTTLNEPILVNDTYIVSAGPYCENLGTITLRWNEAGEKRLVDYYLTAIDETVSEDGKISEMVDNWKGLVGVDYLGRYGLSYDQVIATAGFDLDTPNSGVQEGNNLGELVSDSFLWAVENLEADAPNVPTVAVTADGVLRAPLRKGEINASHAFGVLSMGVGSDGTSGYPLVGVYLTGKELKAAAEVDASVTPIMSAAQLYMSGIAYSFNTHRMFFNRVTEVHLCEPPFANDFDGAGLSKLEDDRLYRVVTGMYSAEMLGTVKGKSMGLLSLEPKMADGTPVTDFNECILRDEDGNEIKEWYALAAYLSSFDGEIPAHYAQADGRKQVSRSWNPIQLIKNPNWLTLVVLLVIAVAAVIITLSVRAMASRMKRRRYGARPARRGRR